MHNHHRPYKNFGVVGVAGIILLLVGAGVTLAAGNGSHASQSQHVLRGAATSLGNLPIPVETNVHLFAKDAAIFRGANQANSALQLGSVSLLKAGSKVDFYGIANAGGPSCFSVGPKVRVDSVIGPMACPQGFPSATAPVLDFTSMHGKPGSPDARVWQSVGFAASGVANIAFQTPDGSLIDLTPVVDDMFEVTTVPTVEVTKIVALDASGQVVWGHALL
jgi:hypothetical protein